MKIIDEKVEDVNFLIIKVVKWDGCLVIFDD